MTVVILTAVTDLTPAQRRSLVSAERPVKFSEFQHVISGLFRMKDFTQGGSMKSDGFLRYIFIDWTKNWNEMDCGWVYELD